MMTMKKKMMMVWESVKTISPLVQDIGVVRVSLRHSDGPYVCVQHVMMRLEC